MTEFREPTGISFYIESYIPLKELSGSVCKVLSFLQAEDPYTELYQYEDWWEHDGLHFPKGTLNFHQLFQTASSPRSLFEAMPGDQDVRIGISPKSANWYLRMYVTWDDNDEKLEGDFDITLPNDLSDKFRIEITPTLPCKIFEETSENYFSRIKN